MTANILTLILEGKCIGFGLCKCCVQTATGDDMLSTREHLSTPKGNSWSGAAIVTLKHNVITGHVVMQPDKQSLLTTKK